MRTIKFRAWDKKRKEMLDDISHFDLLGPRKERKVYYYYPEQIGDDEWDIAQGVDLLKGVVLMQFTGLKDKNGKEIYEGDILQDKRRVRCVVSWGKHDYDGVLDGWGWNIGTPEKWYEVIGNIYENPELMPN